MKFKRGFTLAELIIVAAIIAILTAVVLANLATARAKGRDARRAADVKQLQQAVENYFENNYSYPVGTDAAALAVLAQSPNKILASIAKDPLGADYCYVGTATSYCLGVNFEDLNSATTKMGPSSSCDLGSGVSGGGKDDGLNGPSGDNGKESDQGKGSEDQGKGGEEQGIGSGGTDAPGKGGGCVSNYRVGGP